MTKPIFATISSPLLTNQLHEDADRCIAKFGGEPLSIGDSPDTENSTEILWEVPAANAEAAKAELESLGFAVGIGTITEGAQS